MAASNSPGDEAPRPEGGLTIGWKEHLDLPALGVFRMKAKVDTGARTSTLHVDSLRVLEILPDGTERVEIDLQPDRRQPGWRVRTEARVLRRIRVVDSGGHPEVRPVIETELVLGPVRKTILITLTDRSGMLFRMILGRKALEGDFRVDVSARYLLRQWHPRRPRRR